MSDECQLVGHLLATNAAGSQPAKKPQCSFCAGRLVAFVMTLENRGNTCLRPNRGENSAGANFMSCICQNCRVSRLLAAEIACSAPKFRLTLPLWRFPAMPATIGPPEFLPTESLTTMCRLLPAFACLLLIGCSESSSSSSDPKTTSHDLALNWYPEAEHGGFLAAEQFGLFKKQGVEVNVIPGSVSAPNTVIQELAAGRISFAVSNADLIVLARAKGVPIVAVAAPLQQSPRCLLVHESCGFNSLHDLKDVELAIKETRPFALWLKKQVPLEGVTFVPFSGSVGEYLQKEKFAQQAYVFSEPFTAKENGSDPQVLPLSEIGFNPYASLLVTTEDMIQNNPDVVTAVVQASVEGWESYLQDCGPVNESINAANKDMSLGALQFGADSLQALCEVPEGTGFGSMTSDRWGELISQIETIEQIDPGSVKAEDCFTNDFLPSR